MNTVTKQDNLLIKQDSIMTEGLMKEREEEIIKLQKQMLEVNELFEEMYTLVQMSAPQVDVISMHISTSETQVDDAVKQIEVAYKNRPCSLI